MDHTKITSYSQDNIHVQSKIDDFFDRFRIGTLLHRYGVRKRHGYGIQEINNGTGLIKGVDFRGDGG